LRPRDPANNAHDRAEFSEKLESTIFQFIDDDEQLDNLIIDVGAVESPEVLEILTNISGQQWC
jgi:hypothetical protein